DNEPVVDVATLGAGVLVELRRALAAQALDRPVAGAAGDAQRLAAVERRHLHLGAAGCLRDRQRALDPAVVPAALEDRRLGHVRDRVQVARRPAVAAGLTLPGETDARPLADPGGDVDPVALDGARGAGPAACGAALLDHGAAPAALRARL